ncbi:MAG TPA: F0F1 ATP synthase subunit epsilon [bacterium]|nr:F0F1 ATP synthase subunit epsilon [bacterium]
MAISDKTFSLEIMTPLKSAFKGDAQSLIAKGTEGYFGVLSNHAPMLAALDFGPLFIRDGEGKDHWFVVSNGFFEVRQNRAALLIETCESKEEVDVERAKAAKERAEKRLSERDTNIDVERARNALARALARIQLASR